MKLTKKIIVAALAIVGLSFTACMKDITDNGIIKKGSNGIDAYVDYENEAADDGTPASWVRSLKTARQQHSGGIFTIRQTVHNTGENGDGMMGAVFGLTENTSKGTYNFFVAGTSIQNGVEHGYISYFVNITKEDFQKRNFGATSFKSSFSAMDAAAKSATDTTEYEWEIAQLGDYVWIPAGKTNEVYQNGKYEIDFFIEPLFDESTKKYTGKYKVSSGKNLRLKNAPSTDGDYKKIDTSVADSKVYRTVTIDGVFNPAEMGNATEQGKMSKLPQYKTGYYVNVYAGRTLTGEWELQDTINAVVEE